MCGISRKGFLQSARFLSYALRPKLCARDKFENGDVEHKRARQLFMCARAYQRLFPVTIDIGSHKEQSGCYILFFPYMDILPGELIAQILSYLHPIYEDLPRYCTICRRWERIIQNTGLLWRHIHLHDDRDAHQEFEDDYASILCHCFKKYGHFIQCIRAEDQTYFTRTEVRRLLTSLPNLTRLDIPVLSWSRVFAQSLKSAPVFKFLTIDDYRALVKRRSHFGNRRLRIHKRGIRVWDLRVLARQFKSLESLTLNINIFKLCRHGIVPILDELKLKELHLECAPYGMEDLPSEESVSLPPIKALMNSRHSPTLVSLDLHYLPIGVSDLVSYLENFKFLKQLFVAFADGTNTTSSNSLVLKSSSLATLFLTGLPSRNIDSLKCVLPNLEVLLISECHYLTSVEILATNILTFILQGNCQLSRVKAHCKGLHDLLMYECPAIEPDSFKDFLSECPNIRQMEVSVDWSVIELDREHCNSLIQLTIRDVGMSLSKLKVDCPTLEYFKCSGDVFPEKQKNSKSVAGCDIEISANSLKKVQIFDIGSANRVTVHCIEAHMIQVTGLQPWQRPLIVELNASRRVGTVFLTGLTIGLAIINSTDVDYLIIENCSLAHKNKQRNMRFKCKTIRGLSLLRCSSMKSFNLHVSCVENLSIDSCSNLRDLDISASRLHCIRIIDCPHLEPVKEMLKPELYDGRISSLCVRDLVIKK